MGKRVRQVYQFRIQLREVEPPVWRRIHVPETYTFWDLHVAIQDAMGWLDCHLHVFELTDPATGSKVEFGIPDDDVEEADRSQRPGWEYQIADYFSAVNPEAAYTYDFGDNWRHTVTLEEILPRVKWGRYPQCLDGARACPHEDCGGPPGYDRLLRILRNPAHEDYEDMRAWVGGRFDPEAFDPARVMFDDPEARWVASFVDL